MGFSFGSIVTAVFPKKKEGESLTEKVRGRAETREHIKWTTRIIKQAIREPNELPSEDNVPAIAEFLKNYP